jgi:hypothetical protein
MGIVQIAKTLYIGSESFFAGLMADILGAVRSKLSGQNSIDKALKMADSSLAVLNDSINRSRKNEFTVQINDADKKRSLLYRAILMRIGSDMNCFYDEVLVQNATLLNNILVEIGKPLKRTVIERTNQFENVFSHFNEHPDIITSLGYKALYDNFVLWHNNFRNLSQAGAEKSSSKQNVPRLSEAFDNAYEALSKLFKRIEVDEDEFAEPFTSTIGVLNQVIDDAQKIQRSRITREETGDNNNSNGGDVNSKSNNNKNSSNSAGSKNGKSAIDSDNTGEKTSNEDKNDSNEEVESVTAEL